MTSLYVYALLPEGNELPTGLYGFHDVPCEVVAAGDLAAVIARHDGEQPGATPERVQAHHRVIEALREGTPALPVQFGTLFGDEQELREAISEQHGTLLADMERLDGTVEYGISTLWGSALDKQHLPEALSTSSPASGADYMQMRLAQHRREGHLREMAETLEAEIDAWLREISIETESAVLPTMNMPVRARFLVHSTSSRIFEATVSDLRASRPQYQFMLVGPWPPYSFLSGAGQRLPGTEGATGSSTEP